MLEAEAQSVPFNVRPGDWQELSVNLSAHGALHILRVYLPAQQQPVEIDWVELKAGDQKRVWQF